MVESVRVASISRREARLVSVERAWCRCDAKGSVKCCQPATDTSPERSLHGERDQDARWRPYFSHP